MGLSAASVGRASPAGVCARPPGQHSARSRFATSCLLQTGKQKEEGEVEKKAPWLLRVLGLGDTEAGVLGDEDFTFLEKLFTCVSAFASVGFDLGVTARLDRWGQLVLLVGMFIGRLGILLLLSALFGRRPPSRVRYPQEELIL